ncbi:OprO/OprP family phosphate-selective porin [Sphingomonas sp.]|uniref:OprO/OprP family phosphate-selective porin n=1 Tax=Sphingomonas sp. TaxID=28214 RepID=UPI003AFF70C2
MRIPLLGGASLAAVLVATPALAQPPAGNAQILDRLNALEQRLDALQTQNADLKRQLDAARGGQATAAAPGGTNSASNANAQGTAGINPPLPAAASGGRGTVQTASATPPALQWTIVPQFNSPDGNFTFKPRGILDVDYAAFNERRGGYDYSNGTQIRRGRFGFDGTLFKELAYRIEAEYVGGQVSLLDAFVAYTQVPHLTVTLGQLKVPAGLEANSSDAFNEFMERGMANVAFGSVGGERRVGLTVAYADPIFTATGGIYGSNEGVSRSASVNAGGEGFGPDEVWGFNGRVTAEPINKPGRLLHVGASAYHVEDYAGKDLTIADRPNVRVDNGNLESVAFAGTQSATALGATVHDATFYGFEGAGVYGPFSVQGEYSHMHLNRIGDVLPSVDFDGWYAFGSYFLTGESRPFKGGVIDRLKPNRPFDPRKGNWGAFELAGRYDRLNLTDHDISPLKRDGHAITAALNWYLTGNVKILFNYIRFTGQNSPLVRTPVSIFGTTAKGEAFATRLHLDF